MNNLLRNIAQAPITNPLPTVTPGPNTLQNVLSVVFGLLGAISLVVIVLAGFRYTISMGDPGATSKAKNTIIYAAVGLLVSLLAYSILTFVMGNI